MSNAISESIEHELILRAGANFHVPALAVIDSSEIHCEYFRDGNPQVLGDKPTAGCRFLVDTAMRFANGELHVAAIEVDYGATESRFGAPSVVHLETIKVAGGVDTALAEFRETINVQAETVFWLVADGSLSAIALVLEEDLFVYFRGDSASAPVNPTAIDDCVQLLLENSVVTARIDENPKYLIELVATMSRNCLRPSDLVADVSENAPEMMRLRMCQLVLSDEQFRHVLKLAGPST